MKNNIIGVAAALLYVLFFSLQSCQRQGSSVSFTGKEIYIPKEFSESDFSDTLSRYCFERMDTTDNIVYFWEKGFGKDIASPPMLDSIDMKFDFEGLKAAAERFYIYYRDTLKFIEPGSLADKYRMMVMINYSEESTAYGGSYDNVIGAIWVTPQRLHEEKFNCIAHELGHAFQAQIAADGLTSASGPLWEVTSQWMLFHVNPYWMTDENYHWQNYMQLTHLHPFNPETMYCNPYLAEYWSQKHGLGIMSRIWRNNTEEHDPILVYQQQTGIGQEAFNDECFDAALRFITYDLDRIRHYAKPYRNAHKGTLTKIDGEGRYSVDEKKIPQTYGYNGIELSVPPAGTEVVLALDGVKPDGIEGEWNYALLPVRDDSVADYAPQLRARTVDAKGGEVRYVVPEGLSHLWLVVNAVPAEHQSEDSAARWKYNVTLKGAAPKK